ncbi:hypothetical protein ABPG74_014809 [Tetrahymena malaccensis]
MSKRKHYSADIKNYNDNLNQQKNDIKQEIEYDEPLDKIQLNNNKDLEINKYFQVKQEYIETENDQSDLSQQLTRQIKPLDIKQNEQSDKDSMKTNNDYDERKQLSVKIEEKDSKNCNILMKQDFRVGFKINHKDLSSSQISRNYFSSKSKFYLFADQIIDLDYMRSILKNEEEEYLKENTIKRDSDNKIFKSHIFERTLAGDILYNKIISNLDPKKIYYFNYYKINYEKQQLDSCQAGYSPMIQEVLAGNSYAFKEYLSQQGFIDPLCQQYRLTKCFTLAGQFLSFYQERQEEETVADVQTYLYTLDNFRIPVQLKTKRIYLNHKYDQENGLNFNTHNILALYEFQLLDESFLQELQKARFDTKYQQILHNKENDYYRLKSKVENIEFIQKHYQNQIFDLLNKGSKWLKRCGFVDIPTKKQKKEEYKIEYID